MTDPKNTPELATLPMVIDAVRRAQEALAAHVEPGGPSETDTINELLGILDHYKLVRALATIEPVAGQSAAQLLDDIHHRERGRIALVNALKDIADNSTSHEDAIERARRQLTEAGVFSQATSH